MSRLLVDPEGRITPRCMVCRTELPADPFLCPRCETPSHRDCWEYTGGCAVYGCSAARNAPVPRPPPAEWRPGERWQGALFGSLLGFGLVGGVFSLTIGSTDSALLTLYAAAAAALTGALTGYFVRGPEETLSIFFWGTVGPGLGAWLIATGALAVSQPRDVSAAPVMLIGFVLAGMLTAPMALPCAYAVARFNDPRSKNSRRQTRWILAAATLVALAAVTASSHVRHGVSF